MRKTKLRDLFALHQVLDESSLEDCIRLVIELNVRYAWYIVNNNNNNNNNNDNNIYILYYLLYKVFLSLTYDFLDDNLSQPFDLCLKYGYFVLSLHCP